MAAYVYRCAAEVVSECDGVARNCVARNQGQLVNEGAGSSISAALACRSGDQAKMKPCHHVVARRLARHLLRLGMTGFLIAVVRCTLYVVMVGVV